MLFPKQAYEDAWKVCGNEKDLSVSRGTAGIRKRNTHCILRARTRGKEKKGGREGWSLKAWASRNSDVAFGLETTRTSGSCSLGGHDWPVCYHMGFAVTTKYLKPHRAVRIAFLDSPEFLRLRKCRFSSTYAVGLFISWYFDGPPTTV